jgi:hypothetical protein
MQQPNSTARAVANKALVALGHIPIATDDLYATGVMDSAGNLNTQLDKYQQQAVTFLDIFHQTLSLVMNKPFMYRRFQLQTNPAPTTTLDATNGDYVLNNVIIEGLRANSFFNVTYGAGPGNPIHVIPYEQYNQMYARPDIVPIGTPLWLVPLPDDGSGNTRVRIVPTPDQVYVIEGQCRYLVPSIKKGTDQIAFPYRYEAPLIFKLMEVMETRLNEGREASVRMYAEQFVAEMIRDASGAEEEVDRQDLGFTLWGGWRRDSARDYNPATDVVSPYP